MIFVPQLGADEVAIDSVHSFISQLTPEAQHKKVTQLISHILLRNHYKDVILDDSLSSKMFQSYFDRLDPNRMFFLRSDMDSFEKYRYRFDEYLSAGFLTPAYEIFTVYQKRFASWLAFVFWRLDQPFDFTKVEYLQVDREQVPWPIDQAELEDFWTKRLKNDALNLKIAGKDWEGIRKTLRNRYKNIRRRMSQYQSEDVYQVVMNSFTESIDPYTSYFSPKSYDNFEIHMFRSFEGIGARLSTQNDFTVVTEIIPGGPADKSNSLYTSDKIIGVAQGYDGEIIDVIGWRLDDVVQLIRGKKSTTVRLQIIRADAPLDAKPDTIALVRDKVTIEDQSAEREILEIIHEDKKLNFAVITIPAFYSDFEARRKGDKNYKSTTRDVKKLLTDLDLQGLDGVIIDLRGNGGGFLNEAVELTGLFIEKGPVVQVRDTQGKVEEEWDYDPEILYSGPLAVLVDRMSASASEIFAAAIQDYKRGIVIGGQTFGKGTVQHAIDLNRFLPNSPQKLGQLKMTIAKFYRIDGGSTQQVGVLPDITLPSRLNFMDLGETSHKNALIWDQIKSSSYDYYSNISDFIPKLEMRHNMRVSNNERHASLLQEIASYKEQKDKKIISLNEQKRREERKKFNADEEEESADQDSTAADNQQKKKEDLLLNESAHILGDYIVLTQEKLGFTEEK
jgi:carboxyl-terminal processing protease